MRNSYERRRSFRIFCCLCSSKLCLKYAMAEGTGCSQLRAKAGEEERVRKTSLSGRPFGKTSVLGINRGYRYVLNDCCLVPFEH